ncbi:MAG: class I SAM-dependent methyltransferase, partial [bacterium]|nr:class I SAM-dependent methyltransferase [bacterium]
MDKDFRLPTEVDAQSTHTDFQKLVPQDLERKKQLSLFIEQINQSGGTYHRLNFGDGLIMQGIFDLTKHLSLYNIPDTLEGKTVLDIGTAAGFFALECARRGGQVTAIDVYGGFLPQLISLLNVRINYLQKSIYELDSGFGQFDLVICGSLLMHLTEPFEAIKRIRSVCRKQAIISTMCSENYATEPRPICEFLGWKATDGDHWTYWDISASALKLMLLIAGFTKMMNERHFTIVNETSNPPVVVP